MVCLPTLSPRDLHLLQAYFSARCDIFLLAQKQNLPVLDLLAWSNRPAVQAHIAALKKLTDDSLHLRTAQARLLSLDTLEKIVKTTEDPVELRRAATTIYRGGAAMPQPRPPRPEKPDPDQPPPRYLPPKYRRLPLAQLAGFHPPYIPPRATAHDSFNGNGKHARTPIPRANRPAATKLSHVPRVGRSSAGPCRPRPIARRSARSPIPPTSKSSRSARTSVPPAAARKSPRPVGSRRPSPHPP